MTDGCDREGSEKPKTHKDVMNRVHIIVVGTILVVPAISAPNSYLNRLGPKPLNFGAPPRPLEEVMAMLPILNTDLPPKPIFYNIFFILNKNVNLRWIWHAVNRVCVQ